MHITLSKLLLATALGLVAADSYADGIVLVRTVGTDLSAGACGTDSALTVETGTQVNFCYRVTNQSSIPLVYQSLESAEYGQLLSYAPITLQPGASYQFNDIRIVATDVNDDATWTADNQFADYSFAISPSGQAFEDISATGASPPAAGFDLGFDFDYYGETQTQGFMYDGEFGFSTSFAPAFQNASLPGPFIGKGIFPYWDEWTGPIFGPLYFETRGSAPNRRLIAQWQDNCLQEAYNFIDCTAPMTYEMVLYEGSNQIAFVYAQLSGAALPPVDANGGGATVGLSYDDARAVQVGYNQSILSDGMSILFTPTTFQRYTASASVTVQVASAAATVSADSLSVGVAVGASTSSQLAIGNSGTLDLIWQLDPTLASNSHFPAHPRTSPAPTSATTTAAHLYRSSWQSLPYLAAPHRALPSDALSLPALGTTTASDGTLGFVSLDINAPGTLTAIAANNGLDIDAGAIAGTDFAHYYGLDWSSGELYRLDVASGVATDVGPSGLDTDRNWSDMSWDPITGKMYALASYPTQLYTIDLDSGAATSVATLTDSPDATIIAIAFNSMGQLYAVDIRGDRLLAVDRITGTWAVIGALGVNQNFGQALAFDRNTDRLYLAGPTVEEGGGPFTSSMYTVDTQTGQASLIGVISSDPINNSLQSMGIESNSPCEALSAVPWLTVSPTSGTTAPGASDNVTVGFDASALTPGHYSAVLCLASNDPVKPSIRVPVYLEVNPLDRIFADGFDGTPGRD
ncbi:MAG: hypothetical protein ABI843_01625 [Dokdonella sp.]